jgi:hypothetical protein
MFRILDLISWVGMIILGVSAILALLKIRSWVVLFSIIFGFVLFLVSQFLMVTYFKTVRGARFHYITGNDVDLYIGFIYWVVFWGIVIFGAIKKYYNQ